MGMEGRINNSSNQHQGQSKRVLCVCSAGLLRSPTAAHILSAEPFNFNTRAAGIEDSYALIVVDTPLLLWADEVICVDKRHYEQVKRRLGELANRATGTIVHLVECADNYGYRNPQLVNYFTTKFKEMYLDEITDTE